MTKGRNILINNWEYVAVQKRNNKTEDILLLCIKSNSKDCKKCKFAPVLNLLSTVP
jgi:hypothetical protein